MSSLPNDQDLVDYQEEEDQAIDKDKIGAAVEDSTGRGSYVAIHTSGFRDFFLKPELLRAIGDAGFEHPSEVQHETIPHAITGVDVLCQAKSGMGKTAVFVLSILQQLNPESNDVMCIGLAHTRELAFQIKNEFDRFSKHMKGILCEVVFGGVPIQKNIDMLSKPETTPHILIGSPGRLLALLRQQYLKTDKVAHFVLDECDKCLEKLDMRKDVQEIFTKTPKKKQVMMFSATLSREVREVCRKFLQNPVEVFVDDETKLTLHGLIQHYVKLTESEKNRKLNDLLDKLEFNQVIIFVKSVQRAQALDRLLTECSFPSICIHAGLEQPERIARYQQFKNFEKRIMVATDLFGRGIDIERVNIVINYDMPDSTDTYLHRVGRAGRFGTKGLAITFVASQEDSDMLNQVQARFEVSITEIPSNLQSSSYIILTLDNVSLDTVAFKIKTTAPKNYLVRPSTGVIAPGKTQEIKIVLQPIPSDVSALSDRFLVQAAVVEQGTQCISKEFWSSVDKAAVQDQRLSVVFKKSGAEGDGAPSSSAAAAAGNGVIPTHQQTRSSAGGPPSPTLTGSSGGEGAFRRLPEMSATTVSGTGTDAEAKYNELLQYCLAVEKQKALLAKEVETLRQQQQQLHPQSSADKAGTGVCRTCGGERIGGAGTAMAGGNTGATVNAGYELWHVVAVVVGAVLTLKLFNFLWTSVAPERSYVATL